MDRRLLSQKTQRKDERYQLLIERQKQRLERSRLVAEQRRLDELKQIEIENQKLIEIENIEKEKIAVIQRRHKQAKHLENWNLHFGNASANRYDSSSSKALSPSTPFISTLSSKIIVRRRGARRNVSQLVIPYSSTIVEEAKLEVQRQYKIRKDMLRREENVLKGPLVGSTWTQSIQLLNRAKISSGCSSGGIFTSTPTSQQTVGSGHCLSSRRDDMLPLRPGESSYNERNELYHNLFVDSIIEKEKYGDEESVSDYEEKPTWRTDLIAATTTTTTTTTIQSKHRTTYIDDTFKNAYYNGLTCRSMLSLELSKFQLIMMPLKKILIKKYEKILLNAWMKLWQNVNYKRSVMFRLGESRLKLRKARKHYWFYKCNQYIKLWCLNVRYKKEMSLRLHLILNRARMKLLRWCLHIKWFNFMKITKNEYMNRITKASSHWTHLIEGKAFRGWKAAISKNVLLRKIIVIKARWQKDYVLTTSVRQWKVSTVTIRNYMNRCHTLLHRSYHSWLYFVTLQQKERRYLQRAGRKWRMSSKLKYFKTWKTFVSIQIKVRYLFQKLLVIHEQSAKEWGWSQLHQWYIQSKEEFKLKEEGQHELHKNGLCDCLKRFQTKCSSSSSSSNRRRKGRRGRHFPPLRAFNCSMEKHLELRLNDAHDIVKSAIALEKTNNNENKKQEMKRHRRRRESTIIRTSHWM